MSVEKIKKENWQPLDDDGLQGIICPHCGARIPLLHIFMEIRNFNGIGDGELSSLEEEYDCDCGERFKVKLDIKYCVSAIPEKARFVEETIVPLDVEKAKKIELC